MLLVVASRYDETAASLAARWTAHDAVVATPSDLSRAGWQLSLGDQAPTTAAVDGRVVDHREIDGVLTRIPGIWAPELADIDPAEREYVASEMTAFLLAWLSGLDCPVVNPPTPSCLSGPYWRPERWLAAAAELGIPVRQLRRRSDQPAAPDELPPRGSATATVVGERVLGKVDSALAEHALALARGAGTPLLGVRFSDSAAGACFLGAELWPDLGPPEVSEAVLELLVES
jgi:hypothetical protein